MNVNAAGGLFRGYCVPAAAGKKAGASSPLADRAKSDQVTLSKQVLAVVQMQNRLRAIEQAKEQAKNAPEAQVLDSMRKAMKVLKICNKIAARVRAGDHVPLEDLRYLMKHDVQAYQMAMASRKPKEDPKEWESAIPNEEQEKEPAAGYAGGDPDGASASSVCACSPGPSPGGSASGGTGTDSGGAT